MEETKPKTPEEIRVEIFETVWEMAKTKPERILWTVTDWFNWSMKIKKDIEALTDTRHAPELTDEMIEKEAEKKCAAFNGTFFFKDGKKESMFIFIQACKWAREQMKGKI